MRLTGIQYGIQVFGCIIPHFSWGQSCTKQQKKEVLRVSENRNTNEYHIKGTRPIIVFNRGHDEPWDFGEYLTKRIPKKVWLKVASYELVDLQRNGELCHKNHN